MDTLRERQLLDELDSAKADRDIYCRTLHEIRRILRLPNVRTPAALAQTPEHVRLKYPATAEEEADSIEAMSTRLFNLEADIAGFMLALRAASVAWAGKRGAEHSVESEDIEDLVDSLYTAFQNRAIIVPEGQ